MIINYDNFGRIISQFNYKNKMNKIFTIVQNIFELALIGIISKFGIYDQATIYSNAS